MFVTGSTWCWRKQCTQLSCARVAPEKPTTAYLETKRKRMLGNLLRNGVRNVGRNTTSVTRLRAKESVLENYQIGDYPHVPFINRQARSPYKYDDVFERRNVGEPLHEQDEILAVHTPNPYYHVSTKKALGSLLTMFGALYVFYLFLGTHNHDSRREAVPKTESKYKSPYLS